jgi:hypothetical protein
MHVKPRVHFTLDTLIFLAFALIVMSGLVQWLILPSGYQGGRHPEAVHEFFNLTRSSWKDIHKWAGVTMAALVSIHLLFHLPWITCQVKRLFGRANSE